MDVPWYIQTNLRLPVRCFQRYNQTRPIYVYCCVTCRATARLNECLHASRRTRGPIDNISFGAPVWPVTKHSVMFRILGPTSVPNSVNDMACCIISVTMLTSWNIRSFFDIRAQRLRCSSRSLQKKLEPAGLGRTAVELPRA